MAYQSSITTPKGTKLPLLDLRGKDYLQVAHRLVWFREEHPTWTIETEPLTIQPDHAIFHARVKDETGRTLATGTKHESKQGFFDFIEKAETGAIGRALALCGYGTQFAPEFDEGERIVDSPVVIPRTAEGPAHRPAEALPAAAAAGAKKFAFKKFEAGDPASTRQLQFVADLAVRKLGANPDDRADILAKLNHKFGLELRTWGDLTKTRARNLIDGLQALPVMPAEDSSWESELDLDVDEIAG